MMSHDLVNWAPSKLYRRHDGIGQTPCSYERYLVTDKTNASDLPSGVFTILISVTRTKKYKIRCHSTNFVKNWQTVT